MKRFLIILFLSYVSSDKLDLTYLPPPGSQYAGGRSEDIQTPLEYPKETYSTTIRPSTVTIGPKVPNPDDYKATIGINRIAPVRNQASFPAQGSNTPFNNYQNSFNVPSTTVSYAFTQTTTHPPSESFETTLSPNNPITGFPTTAPFNVQSQEPSQIYRGNNNQFPPDATGHQQYSTGDQSTPGSIAQFPGSSFPSSYDQFYGEPNPAQQSQFQQGFQQSGSGRRPGFISNGPFQQSQYPGNQSSIGGLNRKPGLISPTNAPLGQTSNFYPSITNNMQGFITAIPDIPQESIFDKSPNVYQPGIKLPSQNKYPTINDKVSLQQYPEYSGLTAQAYQPISTVAPTIFSPGFGNQKFSAGDLSSPVNSGDSDQGRIGTNAYFKRPERLQAEADRNAVILNYKNVISPEGYEYSFDTSNGIHADENGTAIGGVKAEGSYSYTGDDGKVYTVVYTADENGFRPRGDHLPTPPPVPEAIQRLIEKANQDKADGIFDDGSYDEGKYGHEKYQVADNRYPQGLDRITSSGIRVPDKKDDFFPTSQLGPKNKFYENQPSSKKPTKDFDDLSDTQEQIEDDQLVEDEIRKSNKIRPYSRPVNRISNQGIAEQYPRKQTSDSKISRRPTTNTEASENQDEFYNDNDKNSQRPSGTKYSSENKDQYIGELSTGEESKPENISDKNISNKGVSRRPYLQQQQQQIGAERIRKPGNNRQKIIARPFNEISQDNIQSMFDELENKRRLTNRLPSRRPTDQSVTGKDGLESPEVYNQKDNRNKDRTDIRDKPNRVLSKYLTETTEPFDKDFTSSSEVPFKFRPNGMNKLTIKMNTEQLFSTKRRPSRPGLKVDNESSDNQGSIDDIPTTYGTEDDAADIYSNTTPVPKDRFHNTQVFEPKSNQQPVTKIPQSFITKYSSPRDKIKKPQPSYQNERIDRQRLENVKYGQRLRDKPTVSPSTNIQEYNRNVFDSTGYQYIPPKNRFSYGDENNYSTVYPETGTSIIKEPSKQLTQYKSKNAIAKPFMTPNVSRVETTYPEDEYDETVEIDNKRLPNQQRYEENPKVVVNNEQYTTPDQIFSDEVISTGKPLQTTRIPQFNQKYPTTPGYKTTPEGTIEVFQKKFDGKDSDTQTPYEVISSTTPSTGRPSYYTTPKDTLTPGQKNVYNSNGNDNQGRPFNIASLVTPSPSQSPVYGRYYPEENTENQYQTTYQPNQPTTTYDRITSSGLPNTGPSEILQAGPKTTQNIYGNQLPSTTYRPNYAIKGNEVFSGKPRSQLDDYGRPDVNYEGQGKKEEYSPDSDGKSPVNYQNTSYEYGSKVDGLNKPGLDQNQDFKGYQTSTDRINGRPFVNIEEQGYEQQFTSNSDDRTPVGNQNTRYQYGSKFDGLNKAGLGQNPEVQGYQTSTEQFVGEDFSGPKQQQRFDPKLGYYY